MVVRYHKRFIKRLSKLSPPVRTKVTDTIKLFSQSPTHPRLRNHALKGNLEDRRAISVTSNLRIIFHQENNYKFVTMLDVGTHNQVY